MTSTCTAFLGDKRIDSGSREELAGRLARIAADRDGTLKVFDDETGRAVDLDYRGVTVPPPPRPAGRPRLGVQAREVTLLPRHWAWLAEQRGGASATIRRLVDEAGAAGRSPRDRQDAAYRFMQAACGDRPGYEAALRALYRSDREGFASAVADWPEDLRTYIQALLGEA